MTGTFFGVRRRAGSRWAAVALVALVSGSVTVGPMILAASPASATTSGKATEVSGKDVSGKLATADGDSGKSGSSEGSGKKTAKKHSTKPLTPQQQAKAALLTLADMPAGWVALSKAEKSSHTAPLSTQLAKCIGVSSSVATTKPLKVSSPDFTSLDRTQAVEDSVSVYDTKAEAKAAFKAMARPKTPTCMGSLGGSALRTSIQAEAGTSATVGAITIEPLPAGALAAGEAGFEVNIPLASSGKDLTISSTQVDVQEGKVLQQLTFNGNGTPFNSLEQLHLLQRVSRPS